MLSNQLPSITLEFNNINYRVPDTASGTFGKFGVGSKQTKTILKDISGCFKPGELTAIMGPSGAGKSSLMNILAGYRKQNVQGTVSVNGKLRDLSKFRKISSYVMQFDVHLENLTVHESMRYAAQLKLSRNTSKEQRELVILDILDTIGLLECKDVKASNVSGGQRKRLSIALELINNPPIMWLDEPTSGLDSASCFSCITLLKSLAQGGRTIIATIHQPSARIFEQFDSLYLLSEGQNLYRGSTQNIIPFMGRQGLQCPEYHNVADFVIEVASGDYGREWIGNLAKANSVSLQSLNGSSGLSNFSDCSETEVIQEDVKTSLLQSNSNLPPQPQSPAAAATIVFQLDRDRSNTPVLTQLQPMTIIESKDTILSTDDEGNSFNKFSHQFLTLLKRSMLCVSRDMVLTHLRFAVTIFSALLISAIYHDVGNDASKCFHNAGNLYFSLLFMVITAMMTTILAFPLERGVLVREHLNCWYSLKSYYLARTMADLPFQLFFPLFYVSIMYYMTEQLHDASRFFLVCLVAVLISLVAQSIGLLLGAMCDIESAVFLGPVTAIPVFLFAGCFMTLKTVPLYLRWISWFSYARYAFQSTLTATYGFNRDSLNCFEEYCHFKNPKKFLEMVDAVDINVGLQILCLILMLIVIRVLAYFALRFKISSEIK